MIDRANLVTTGSIDRKAEAVPVESEGQGDLCRLPSLRSIGGGFGSRRRGSRLDDIGGFCCCFLPRASPEVSAQEVKGSSDGADSSSLTDPIWRYGALNRRCGTRQISGKAPIIYVIRNGEN